MAKRVNLGNLIDMHGGPFRLTSIVQKRLRELVRGARPLVDVPRGRKDLIDIVARELDEGRIEPTEDFGEPETTDIFGIPPEEEEEASEEDAETSGEPETPEEDVAPSE